MVSALCLWIWQMIFTAIFFADSTIVVKISTVLGEGNSRREVEALIAFKDSVTNDPLGALTNWRANDSDACAWTGVKCSMLSSSVANLDLRNLGLVGIVPKMIGSLQDLEYLDLSENFLTGSIPDSIANCSNLFYLNISRNQVHGVITSKIGQLVQLHTLVAANNNLTGLIPEALENCSSLEILDLRGNFLEGAIPVTLSKLSILDTLYLGDNILSGTIPSTLGNCSYLSNLGLDSNYRLGGELPEELGLLKTMQSLSLQDCNFVGAFPTWVSNFTSLIHIDLSVNSFSGEIPQEIGKLSENLAHLMLSENQFTGPIPLSIINCTALVWVQLDSNQLTGNIPPDIGLLINLEVLILTTNLFSGVIPSSMSNCSALQWLGLGQAPNMSRQTIPSWLALLASLQEVSLIEMNLYGVIPASLGQLPSLEWCYMHTNYLSGVLPASLGNVSLLSELDLGENQLQGEIPFEITGNLSSLTFLELSRNFFVGRIPKFSNLEELSFFAVQENLLTGSIDSKIGVGSPLLSSFFIDTNHLSGTLPDGIGNFSNLQTLTLSVNSFTGSIPHSYGNLTHLRTLEIAANELTGVIPTTLMSCTQLLQLRLWRNSLEGSIPHEFGQLMLILEITLDNNFLSGTLPSSFSNFTEIGVLSLRYNGFGGVISGHTLSKMAPSLIEFDVSHNLISGSLPPELHLLTNLQYLDISYNLISGSLPRELHLLTNLWFLDVSFNNISGSIAIGMAKCTVLQQLDLSVNNFTGRLPVDLGLLQDLQFFNASFNNFEGPLPNTGLFLTQNITSDSFLGNPGLCGSIRLVSRECPDTTVATLHHCNSVKCTSILIPVVVAISVFLFLGIVSIYWWVLAGHVKTGQNMITEFPLQGRIVLSEQDLMRIIEGGQDNVIGMGGKSIVYKGVLPGGERFALKVLQNENNGSLDENEQLLEEVRTLAQLRHVNIIKILGLTVTPHVKALILEYMPRGSLHDILHNDEAHVCGLSHQERFQIILGIAESLVYLHHSFHDPIIHRDLKPSNILLGMDLEPKLSDFGISKFAKRQSQGDLEASASTICGTFGYMPPEYAAQSKVSTKGDVYSFGVVLLEILTGRKPAFESSSMASGDLVEFVLSSFEEKPFELLDSTLIEEGTVNLATKHQLMLLLRVGVLCTRPAPKSRPDMKDVLGMLKQIRGAESETKTLKTIEELASEITIWDSVSSQQPGDQVASLST